MKVFFQNVTNYFRRSSTFIVFCLFVIIAIDTYFKMMLLDYNYLSVQCNHLEENKELLQHIELDLCHLIVEGRSHR